MTANVGNVDRAVRIAVGVVLLSLLLGWAGEGARWWGLIGIVPIFTALVRWCPAYSILGISSCGTKS
jgi:hypothetical protein